MDIAFNFIRTYPDKNGSSGCYDLCVLDSETLERRTLVEDVFESLAIHWMPDGKRIAFRYRDVARGWFLVSLDGGEPEPYNNAWEMFWPLSLDGRFYAGVQTDNDGQKSLNLLDADRKYFRTILKNKLGFSSPHWLADGRLAFVRTLYGHGVNTDYLYAVEPVSGMPVAFAPSGSVLNSLTMGEHNWSPDSRYIVFRTITGMHLNLMRGDGSRCWKINDRAYCSNMQFSPDGQRIVVHITDDTRSGVYVYDLNAGTNWRIADYHHMSPRWSPDSQWILLMHNRWHDEKIYDYSLNDIVRVSVDGKRTEALTRDGRSSWPIFAPRAGAPLSPACSPAELPALDAIIWPAL